MNMQPKALLLRVCIFTLKKVHTTADRCRSYVRIAHKALVEEDMR